jgi:hypothetical protein
MLVRFVGPALGIIALVAMAQPCAAQVRFEAEAFSGAPFGVGRVTIQSGGDFRINLNRVPRNGAARGRVVDMARKLIDQTQPGAGGPTTDLDSVEITLVEKSGRTFYPVFEKRDRPILREFVATPTANTILFLFEGNAPLELTVYAPNATPAVITPKQDPAGYARLVGVWWRDYAAATDRETKREYPPLVEEYLRVTLSRRMELPITRRPAERESSLFQSELSLLMGTETARLEWAQAILLGDVDREPATERLAEELPEPKPELLNPPANVEIEPIAMRVPIECFYVRFGSFPNFLWLRHRLEDWGGQLRDVVAERGLEYGLNDRMQRQLGLRENALAELLGEKVIADVAMIGTDTFLREGAAVGLLFQAKSSGALTGDLTNQRLAAVKAAGGTQNKVQIGGREVSFFSTPDNSLRSFYVADGDFHLVTSSRKLVEWFLATGAGKHESLGASDEFRLVRSGMPLSRGDSVFVYLAPAFFKNLLSPQYQVELERRLRACVEMELFQIAQLAARGEHKPSGTIDELVAGGFLPQGFGQRPDGSRLEVADGRMIDSLRGGRGTFLPVPDVNVETVTPAEAERHRRFATYYAAQWGRMDPLVAGIRREALPDGLERVTFDIEAAPLSARHAQTLSQWLGTPTDQRVARLPGDVVSFEAVLRGGSYFANGEHHLFGALRDADPSFALDPRMGLIPRMLTSRWEGLHGYLGAWPNPGFLRMLVGVSNFPANGSVISRLLSGLWSRQFNGFTLLSFHPEILDLVSPQLRFEKAPRPAQLWIRADDLAKSQLAPMLNAFGYRQSRQIALGNARFMNMLTEQLHVPAEECRTVGERVLDAKLVEPLGGQYELRDFQPGMKTWVASSIADAGGSTQPPSDYQFPALTWLRGMQIEMSTRDGMLALHGEVVMPVETRPAPFQIPGFNLLGQPAAGARKSTGELPKPAGKPTKPTPARPAPSDVKPATKRAF